MSLLSRLSIGRAFSNSTRLAPSPNPSKATNAALLDAFNELIGKSGTTGVVANQQGLPTRSSSLGPASSYSSSMGTVEVASEFNLSRAEAEMLRQTVEGQRLSTQSRFRFNPTASLLYQPADLLSPQTPSHYSQGQAKASMQKSSMRSPFADPQQEVEVRPAKDIFRRHKYNVSHLHKVIFNIYLQNVFLLSSFLSASGKILHRSQTGLSAKTQRHISRVIRRARQMGNVF